MVPAAPIAEPYAYCVLDLETANGRPEEAERWMRMSWSPNPSWKDETIGARYREMLAKKQERLALLDEAPIIVVCLKSETELRALHAMGAHEPKHVSGALIEGFADQPGMLRALRDLLDSRVGPNTTLAGHNIVKFDTPKLRFAYLAAGLRLPACLIGRDQSVFDTMLNWSRFSLTERPFVALDDCLEVLGLPNHKSTVTGKAVPELHAAGQYEAIINYCLLDVLAEESLFLRMIGAEGA